MVEKNARTEGQLRARPAKTTGTGPIGLHLLGLGDGRDGYLYVPPACRTERHAPLALLLHGAGGISVMVWPCSGSTQTRPG